MDNRKWTLTEIVTVGGVIATVLGTMLVFASNATDRIAIIEVNIKTLQHDVELLEQRKADPLVDARLERLRLDIDKLSERVDERTDR